MKTQIFRRALLGGGALSLLAPFGAAMAETTTASGNAAAALEEIVVTAQRTESSLQRTPIAVTAVSGDDLKARSSSGSIDLQTFTPGLQIGTRSGQGLAQGSVNIRGIGVDADASSPSVGLYVDEVYYPSRVGNLLGFFDVARVEVLRGPQGTLFGRNTIAGAIQYIAVKPGHELTGFAEVTGGNFNRHDFSGALTVPMGETLSARVSFQSTNRDGFVHDDLNNVDRGSDKATQGRVQLRWTPNERLTVDLKTEYLKESNNGRALVVTGINPFAQFVTTATSTQPFPTGLGPFAYTGPFDGRFVSTSKYQIAGFNAPDFFKIDYRSAQGTVQFALTEDITLKSISAFSRSRTNAAIDFDDTPASIIAATAGDPEIIDLFTQELQLTGTSFSSRLHWTGGLYYYDSKDDDNGRGFLVGSLPPAFFVLSNGNTILKTTAKAAYAQGTYNFTDQLSLTLGLRYSKEDVDATNVTYPRAPINTNFSDTSPLIGLNFQLNPDTMLYVKASKGFRAGGFAISNSLASGAVPFGPETAWTYEAGARMEFLDHRLRINPTIYYTDWKNIQFTSFVVGTAPNGLPTTAIAAANAGDGKIRGAELETQYAATERLTLLGSASIISAKYTRIAPTIPLTLDSDFQRTPATKYALGARYTYPMANQAKIATNVDWSYVSKQRSATSDPDAIEIAPYALLNARVQYTAPSGHWSVAAFGTNLTNKYYLTGGVGLSSLIILGPSHAELARPREYGLTVRAGF